jgi:peptide deformylase
LSDAIIKDYELLSVRCDETILQDYVTLMKKVRAMEDILKASDLIFLTANQLGFNDRIFMLKLEDGEIKTFFNPAITYFSKEAYLSREKDYSNDKEYLIVRNDSVELTFQNKNGTIRKLAFQKPLSALIQSIVDLLDGILQQDSGLEIIPEFDEASDEEREEVIKMYLESLKERNNAMQEEIKNDENLSKINDEINHMTNLLLADTEQQESPQAITLNRGQKRKLKKTFKVKKVPVTEKDFDGVKEESKDATSEVQLPTGSTE